MTYGFLPTGPTLWSTVALLCLIGLPALALGRFGFRIVDPEVPRELVAAAAFAVATTAVVVTCELLARLHALTRAAAWVTVAVAALGSVAAIAADQRVRRRLRAAAAPGPTPDAALASGAALGDTSGGGTAGPGWRRPVAGGLVVAAVAAVAAPSMALALRRRTSLVGPAPWYYWWVTRSFADSGGVPSHLTEWGTTVAAFTDHVGFNSTTALVLLAGGDRDSLASAQLFRILSALACGFGVYCLARAWSAPRAAAVGVAALVLSTDVYSLKLSSFRPEGLSYGLVFIATALVIAGLEHGDRWMLGAGAIAVVGSIQVHAIGGTLTLCLVAAVAVTYVVLGFGRPQPWTRRLAIVAVLAAGSGVATGVLDYVAIGKVTPAESIAGLPELGPGGTDPTFAFAQLVTRPGPVDAPGTGAPDRTTLLTESFDTAVGSLSVGAGPVVAGVAFGLLAVMALFDGRARRIALFAALTMAGLLAVSWVLSLSADTYVPRRTGFERLLQLWFVVPAVALAGVAAAQPWRGRHRGIAQGAVAVAVLAFGGWAAVSAYHQEATYAGVQPTAQERAAVAGLPIEAGSTVLTNAYTQGYIAVTTPGDGLLDGRAPYLERDLLGRSLDILTQARAYFLTPAASPFPFDAYGVDYVLVTGHTRALGSAPTFPIDMAALAEDPRLELVKADEDVVLYRVRPAAPATPPA